MATRTLLAALLGAAVTAAIARADERAANTVDIGNGPLSGKTVTAKVLGNACAIGAEYHFHVTATGQLQTQGPLVCGNVPNVGGGILICSLNEDLNCASNADIAPGSYSLTESGVGTGSATFAWANPSDATALFPTIKDHARKKCESVLHRQLMEKNQGKGPLNDALAQEQESCKATLGKLCAAAKGGPVKLDSGKDIMALCR